MRTKFVLTSFALAAALVGCTEDELTTTNANVESQSGMIELGENFMIGAVGVKDATTRTHWELKDGALMNVYSPIAVSADGNNQIPITAGGSKLVNAPSIGLCWIGESIGDKVYTNYEFFHNGWLGKDETTAIFDPCDAGVLKNGWLYSDLSLGASSAAVVDGAEAVTAAWLSSGDITSSNTKYINGDDSKNALNLADMNLNTGVYKTKNQTIFGGDYIAYYPYNPNFKDAGTIPANSNVVFTDLYKNKPEDFKLAENTFRYTNVVSIVGGDQAKGFGFKNLSGVIRLVLKSKSNSALAETVDKILLYSASSAFKKQVRLSAAKISAGTTGTDLYAATDETSKTILAQMETSQALSIVAANATGATLNDATVYLTALPTTVSDLVILAHEKTSGKWAEYAVGNTEIPAGAGKEIVASFASDDFKTVYYAVDQATLATAISECSAASLSADKTASIKVLGDIVLTADATIPSYVTVEGDKIIVPEDKTLTASANVTIKSAIEIQGQTCCASSSAAGKMLVNTKAIIAGNVNVLAGYGDKKDGLLEFAHTVDEVSTVAATATIVADGGSINFKGVTDIYGTLTLNAGGVATLSAATSDVNVKGGTVNNNGTFEVEKGKFAMLSSTGATEPAAGESFKNNGKFIDNIGTTIGGATQYMVIGTNGDYICKVNDQTRLDEAYINKPACSTIQIEDASVAANYDLQKAQKHNEKDVNIVVNTVTGTKATLIGSTAGVNIGNLTVMKAKEGAISASGKILAGNIILNGKLTTAEDLQGMTAKSLTVNAGGEVVFANRTKQGVTLAVDGTIEVKEASVNPVAVAGIFTITYAADSKLAADVTCKKLIEGGTFTGKPRVIK